MKEIERKELVSRGDLYYQGTIKRREGGFPIGDGEMGAMCLLLLPPLSLR